MHRPRHRRKDPKRTGPIRNAGEAWQRPGPPEDSWEPEDDDPASSGVRVGYSVLDEQMRRGRRTAETLHREPREGGSHRGGYRRDRGDLPRYEDEEPRYRNDYRREPWSVAGDREGRGLLGMPVRHLERLVREILNQIVSARPNPLRLAELLLRLQIEAVTELARLGFSSLGMAAPRWGDSYEDDVDRVTRDIDESPYGFDDDEDEEAGEEDWVEEPRSWPAAPSTPTLIRATVPIPVYVSSYEKTEIDLELPAGSQSLDLVVESPLATGTEPAPPAFEAELVELPGAPAILRIEVPRELPAGRYRRRVLIRATGEPVGALTVQVGDIGDIGGIGDIPTGTAPKARKKR